MRYEIAPDLTAAEYMGRLKGGWRRFGPAMFRPECQTCRQCLSLRVPVETFRPNQSQRRAWKANQDLRIVVGEPRVSPETRDLYDRHHHFRVESRGWGPTGSDDLAHIVDNPFPTEEWRYFAGDRLIGIGYVDALPEGLSAITFVYDPEDRRRSLGTFNVLAILAAARQRGLPHVYLGYYVADCASLSYKARFRPHEVLPPGGHWHPGGGSGELR